MVVHFLHDVPSASSSSDERHPAKKKYLVARNSERKSSIFDYVNLSSSLLRKVRYGQSLDAALQTRSPWSGSVASPGAFLDEHESSAAHAPVSIWRDHGDSLSTVGTPSRRNQHSILNRAVTKVPLGDDVIRYGRQVQLQATDGGFLAVDVDGYMVKLPQAHRDDSSTLFTLFPQDPLRAPGSKLQVHTGELCFVVVGAATVSTNHEILYADSKRVVDPPVSLRNAVIRHQRQHRGGRVNSSSDLTVPQPRGEEKCSRVWSFRTTKPTAPRDALENGMLVQITQQDLTLHYEMEQVVKKKYKPSATGGPEADESSLPPEAAPSELGRGVTVAVTDPPASSQPSAFTHVWLQRNDSPSQHETRASKLTALKPKQWDNLWFIIDVTTDRTRERERKQQEAVLEAERDAELRYSDDSDERNEQDPSRGNMRRRHRVERKPSTISKRVEREPNKEAGNNNHEDGGDSSNKRMSVLNARLFVSAEAEEAQRHAAAIIVRFMRRMFRREAERRAKDLIDRRIRRTGKREVEQCTLSTMQQLRILQCFKPNVYGSQCVAEPVGTHSRHVPGISLQGSKYPRQEAQRLTSMDRDLRYLGSQDFQQQQVIVQRSSWQPVRNQYTEERSRGLNLRAKSQQLSKERDRENKFHVQLAMVHREKPPFRFGKMDVRFQPRQRPQTAPASPLPHP